MPSATRRTQPLNLEPKNEFVEYVLKQQAEIEKSL
jgi:hypothetical protein